MSSAVQPFSDNVLEEHYTNLASNYDEFLKYSPDFIRRMTTKMIDHLDLKAEDRFVDLGGGTGIYSVDIMEQIEFREPVLLVDPFEDMLAQAPKDPKLVPLCLDALTFSQEDRAYDKILIKETIHHIDDKPTLFRNLIDRTSAGGRLLLVHIPPEIDYPLFEKALERSRRWHANPDGLVADMKSAGYSVERDVLEYRHRLPKEVYFRMVEGCYMSMLTGFSDEELRAGLAEMNERYRDVEELSFIDRFDFITGTKA